MDRLNSRQDSREEDKLRRVILEWLTPVDYASQQNDFLGRRQEGTGQWLLNSDQFQHLVNQDKRTLFCPGLPGAGKTILTSIVVEHLCKRFAQDNNVGIAYFYFNFRRRHEQTPIQVFSSLLKQFVQASDMVPDIVKELHERYKSQHSRPQFQEIIHTLHSVIALSKRSFIIIDAMDECEVSNGNRTQLLSEICDLRSKTATNLFVTSRSIPEIENKFEGCDILEIQASDHDIQIYLDHQMARLPGFVARSLELQNDIRREVLDAVQGM